MSCLLKESHYVYCDQIIGVSYSHFVISEFAEFSQPEKEEVKLVLENMLRHVFKKKKPEHFWGKKKRTISIVFL